jgi:nitrogen fixation-related uncharacterized protein
MKLLTKLSASSMLFLSFLFFMVSVSALPNLQDKSSTDMEIREARENAFLGITLSLPFLVGGGCLLWGAKQQNQKQLSDRLQSTFYHLVEEKQGRISVLLFAKEANITGIEAKQYLDLKAKEFNALFDLSNEGGIYYYFHL